MPGWDNIPVELLKVLDKDSLAIVVDIFNAVIEGNEDIPDSLKRGILLPLPKKDRIATLSDFRPIVVLSTVYRLFSSVINEQFTNILDEAKIIHPAERI